MRKNYLYYLLIILGLFGIDQITKFIVDSNMALGQSITIVDGFFNLTYVRNTGAGFSILEGQMTFFYVITLVALCFLLYLLFTSNNESKFYILSILMMIAGTLGNFYDRIVYQYVIDFLDFIIIGYDFTVFNFADICLTVGVGIYLLVYFIELKGEYNA